MIAFMTCSMTKSVTPSRLICRSSSIALSISVGFRPAMTSSSRRSSGSIASALASSSRFKSGIVRSEAVWAMRCRRPTRVRTSSARSRACAAVRSLPRAPNMAPIATLSRTESCFKGLTT